MYEFPLIQLFEKLKDSGFSLGVRDYEILIEAMRGGFGINSRDDLENLCRALWVKSLEEQRKFDYLFERYFPKISKYENLNIQTYNEIEIDKCKTNLNEKIKYLLIKISIFTIVVTMIFVSYKMYSIITKHSIEENVPRSIPTWSSTPDRPPKNLKIDFIFIVIMIIFFLVVYMFFLLLVFFIENLIINSKKFDKSKKEVVVSNLNSQNSPMLTISELTREIHDEIELIKILKRNEYTHFRSQKDHGIYLPVTQRRMKQCWRYLRQMVRAGNAIDLDVKATVQTVAKTGILLTPVMIQRRLNLVHALFLIDVGGSMIPFHNFGQRLVDTAKYGGRLGKVFTYYFHNCPVKYLYEDTARLKPKDIKILINSFHMNQAVIIIFSDAGAARGRLNRTRYGMTQKFVSFINIYTHRLVWLNPMPKERWINTTAENISRHINMFSIDRTGLENAIYYLRGRNSFIEDLEG